MPLTASGSTPSPHPLLVGRIEILDILRIVAAMGVVLYHAATMAGIPLMFPDLHFAGRTVHGLRTPTGLGATGNLFFVLSGFVMMRQWWLADGIKPAVFFRNRLARIVPAYWVAIVIAMIGGLAINGFPLGMLVTQAIVHALFLHGLHPSTFLGLSGTYWSLATEAQFYAIFPLCARWLPRVGVTRFVWWSLIITVVCRQAAGWLPEHLVTAGVTSMIRYQLPGRFFEFALGMALAAVALASPSPDHLATRCRRAFWVLIVPALSMRWIGPAAFADPVVGLAYAALCGAVLTTTDATSRLPRWIWRTLTSLGQASYSIFLIQDPVLKFLAAGWSRLVPQGVPLFLALLASLPVIIGSGVLLYTMVERPLWRRWHVPTAS